MAPFLLQTEKSLKQLGLSAKKRTFGHMRPVKIQISLRIRAVWLESSLGAVWIAKDT